MCSIRKSAPGSRQPYSNMLHCAQNIATVPTAEEAQQLILDVSDDEEQD